MEVKEDMEEAGRGRKCESWIEKEGCTLPLKLSLCINQIAAGLR